MPGTVSGASSSDGDGAAAAKAMAREADAGGDAQSQAAGDRQRAQLQAGDDGAAEVRHDRGIPGERIAARRKQDQLLVEQAEVEGQQQRHDDQDGAAAIRASTTTRSAMRAMPSRLSRIDGMALLLAVMPPIVSGLRCASLTGGERRCQPLAALGAGLSCASGAKQSP